MRAMGGEAFGCAQQMRTAACGYKKIASDLRYMPEDCCPRTGGSYTITCYPTTIGQETQGLQKKK
jgi:hypothetical protein